MKKLDNFSKNDLEEIVANSSSFTEVCKKLGYKNIRKNVIELLDNYNIDTSKFKKQGWNKNNFDYSRFRNGSIISSASALKPLTYKRGYRCEKCGLSKWLDNDLPLEIHHIDGNKLNNEESNLLILCPNCHALTDNYRGKNSVRKKNDYIDDETFINALINYPNIRKSLLALGLTAKGANYSRARDLAVKYNIKHILEP